MTVNGVANGVASNLVASVLIICLTTLVFSQCRNSHELKMAQIAIEKCETSK